MRLINADAFILEQLGKTRVSDTDWQGGYWVGVDDTLDDIRNAPTIEAKPVRHGQWIEKPYLLGTTQYCSECGENYGMPHGMFNYCPNCGAEMDGGKDGR